MEATVGVRKTQGVSRKRTWASTKATQNPRSQITPWHSRSEELLPLNTFDGIRDLDGLNQSACHSLPTF